MGDLVQRAKGIIPDLDFILEEAWRHLNLTKEEVESNFGEVLISIDKEATQLFRSYEKEAILKLAEYWLECQKGDIREKLEKIVFQKGWDDFIRDASRLFSDFGLLVQTLERDLGNMRKARGGKTFEKTILKLLNFIGIKGEFPKGEARERLRRIDIVIPSSEVALKTPDRAIFLTCKRTLRERWMQEVPQVRPNQRVYLLTIDEELSRDKANEINEKGLIVFVRDELKMREDLREVMWVRELRELPKELRRV